MKGCFTLPGKPGRLLLLLLLLALVAWAVTTPAAELWYEDSNLGRAGNMPADFASKFRQPETFEQASRHIRVYMVRANVLRKMDDEFIRDVFLPYLAKNGIRLAIDAGGATWTQEGNRERVRAREIELLKRIQRLGGRVDYVSLQSVLSKPLRAQGKEWPYPLGRRIDDVVAYAKAARAVFPKAAVGIIDALPSHGKDYREPYRLLRDAMIREGLKLSFIHLDMPFEIPAERLYGINWRTVREVEQYVEDGLGVKFGFFATSRTGGYRSSKAFHENVMTALECLSGAGGTPGDYIIASWFPHPRDTVPENATGNHYPAMRTVLAFGRRLEQILKSAPAEAVDRSRTPAWRTLCVA